MHKYNMPKGLTRKGVRRLQVFTGAVILLMAYLTFITLEAGHYGLAAMDAAICALNMNGYMNFTRILQANPK